LKKKRDANLIQEEK